MQRLDAKVTPSKSGTAKKPKPIQLQVTLTGSTDDGSVPPASKHVVTRFGKGIVFNGAPFPSCTIETLNDANKGPSKCPAGSKIGTGTARAHIGNDPTGPDEDLVVTVFNGPKGKSTLFHLKGDKPVAVNAAFAGAIKKDTGKYGYKLDVTIPKALYNPVGDTYTPLTQFSVKIKAVKKVKGKSVGILASTSCPKAKRWPFRAEWEYANSPTRDTAEALVKCS
jgi:hypothetical protein